jgi:hypothetical protein
MGANKRKPVRIVLDPDDQPVAKGKLCAQDHWFNLHGATRVAANDATYPSPPTLPIDSVEGMAA